jgi:cysteine desulfurase
MLKKIYMDFAATTPSDPEVVNAMLPYFDSIFANASSEHSTGREAMAAIEQARETIASFLGVSHDEIVFTSGGTESNNHALKGFARLFKGKDDHIITSTVEHPAVSKPCRTLEKEGFVVTYLPVDGHGMVDPDDVRRSINAGTRLISIMHANNEFGTIQPIEDIAKIACEYEVAMHTDAVQSFAHLPFTIGTLGVDMLSASAHKFYGPKGVGFLYIKKGTRLLSFMEGGSQEMGRRASTYNVPGIVGMGKAVELASVRMDPEIKTLTNLRDRLIRGVGERVSGSVLNGHPVKRLPNNVNVTIKKIPENILLKAMDDAGIYCSAGAACKAAVRESTGSRDKGEGSAEQKNGVLRFSLGRTTTREEIDCTIDILVRTVKRLREA